VQHICIVSVFYKLREYGSHLHVKCMYLSLFLFEADQLKVEVYRKDL
jgi:hypothetical protein